MATVAKYGPVNLEYYSELEIPDDGVKTELEKLDLKDLFHIVTEMDAVEHEDDIEHYTTLSHAYWMFSKTHSVNDIQKAINEAKNALAVAKPNSFITRCRNLCVAKG
ncbi:hypothetical protein TWF694_008234 [Orbilia ellipsospora]|uniref:Uncharacterized protein n=1 Tax=Orbilia ellipsospora TaxID=2528407 RepID=A0AAV9XGR0_9PEZI